MSGQKKNGNSKYKGKYNEFSLYFLKLCLTVKAKTIILLEEQGKENQRDTTFQHFIQTRKMLIPVDLCDCEIVLYLDCCGGYTNHYMIKRHLYIYTQT